MEIKMFKAIAVIVMFLSSLAVAQQQEMVSVPKDKLTAQQKAELKLDATRDWVGMGKEIGDAVNSSLAAISNQSNSFAQTPVGKLTVLLVIWKVIGDQAVHILGGVIEMLLFVPIWLWSYRRMCMTRRVKTGKDTWQVVEYKANGYEQMTPRIAHSLSGAVLIAVILITVFSY